MNLGILGGGQLGRMLILAGTPLGFRFRVMDPDPGCPCAGLCELVPGDYRDREALRRFARGLDAVTFEFENVPAEALVTLEEVVPVAPGPQALAVAQDRIAEKAFFLSAGIPVQTHAAVDSLESLHAAIRQVGVPGVLKTRRFGYDGKGQSVVRRPEEASNAWSAVGAVPSIYEAWVPFQAEVSVVAVRGSHGWATWPAGRNEHVDGILHTTCVPAELPAPVEAAAAEHARRLMDALDYRGVLAIEFFLHDGALVANEMAPRVHNSGHWTIDGAATSQFENHLRAVAGLPLGPTDARGAARMVNLVGTHPPLERLLAIPGARVHLYGKSPRPGRKLGHVTVVNDSAEACRLALRALEHQARSPAVSVG